MALELPPNASFQDAAEGGVLVAEYSRGGNRAAKRCRPRLVRTADARSSASGSRSAHVDAATDCRILSLSEGTLRKSIAADPEVAARLLLNVSKILCKRVLQKG